MTQYRVLGTYAADLLNESPPRRETVAEIQNCADRELLCYANPVHADAICAAMNRGPVLDLSGLSGDDQRIALTVLEHATRDEVILAERGLARLEHLLPGSARIPEVKARIANLKAFKTKIQALNTTIKTTP